MINITTAARTLRAALKKRQNKMNEQEYEEDEEYDDMCPRCNCCQTDWTTCWKCGGEGGTDGEELMMEDPMWYDINDFRICDICDGEGGWHTCIGDCDENGKHKTKSKKND